jgi:hypothetical protein
MAHLSRSNRNNQASDQERSIFFGKSGGKESTQNTNAFFQPKLSIGQPDDAYEKEADAVASKVVSNQQSASPVVQQKSISNIQRLATSQEDEKFATNDARMLKDKEIQEKPEIQRRCAECEEEQAVQKKSEGGSTASSAVSSAIQSTGKGNSLPQQTLGEMNASFGVDFSNVNIHTSADAVQMNKELGAQAFTHGSDIYFNNGKYDPGSQSGKELLAHELTHVVQQGASKAGDRK